MLPPAMPSISAYRQGAPCQGCRAGADKSEARGAQNGIKAHKDQIKVSCSRESRCPISREWWAFFWWDSSSPMLLLGKSRISEVSITTPPNDWLNIQPGKLRGQVRLRERFLHPDLRSELLTSQRTYSCEPLSSEKTIPRTLWPRSALLSTLNSFDPSGSFPIWNNGDPTFFFLIFLNRLS